MKKLKLLFTNDDFDLIAGEIIVRFSELIDKK